MTNTVDTTLLPRAGALEADLAIVAGELEHEDTLRSAILISLFTDRRATADELRRHGGDDARGWWGDALAQIEGDLYGSKLWLLLRESETPEVLLRAKQYCEDALAWLKEDGIAREVRVATSWREGGGMQIEILITKPDDVTDRFAFVWEQAA